LTAFCHAQLGCQLSMFQKSSWSPRCGRIWSTTLVDIKLADRLTAETERMFCPKMPRRLFSPRIVPRNGALRRSEVRDDLRASSLHVIAAAPKSAPRARAPARERAGGMGGKLPHTARNRPQGKQRPSRNRPQHPRTARAGAPEPPAKAAPAVTLWPSR